MGEVLRLARKNDPLAIEALELFFDTLDSGDHKPGKVGPHAKGSSTKGNTSKRKGGKKKRKEAAGLFGTSDHTLSRQEWVHGMLQTFAHKTNAEFDEMCDGMVAMINAQDAT